MTRSAKLFSLCAMSPNSSSTTKRISGSAAAAPALAASSCSPALRLAESAAWA
jgi:hypothetical protein